MNSLLLNVSAKLLRRAAAVKERIDALHSEFNRILGTPAYAGNGPVPKKKRRMSAAGRARIAAGARARWAKIKRATGSGKAAQKSKRKMSAVGKARLSALARARWKKAKAQGKTTL